MNDIHKGLFLGTKILLFDEDNLLYRTIANNSETLQKDLEILKQWESINKMEFHLDI